MKDKSMLQHKSTPSLRLFNLSSDPHGIIEKGYFDHPQIQTQKHDSQKTNKRESVPKQKGDAKAKSSRNFFKRGIF
jgi:hypothetical protein